MRARLGAGLADHATRYPDHIALTIGSRDYSYAEVDYTARAWASRLVEVTGRRPARVGIFAHRSEVSYLGTLAALYAGAAFVPLNHRFPMARTRDMVRRAELDVLIVDEASLGQLPELLRGLPAPPAVVLPAAERSVVSGNVSAVVLGAAELASAIPLEHLPEVAPDDHAYLLFTSGSSGEPKGVPVTHANIRSFLDTNQRRYGLTPQDRLSQTFDQTFDLSVFDLFMAWEHGARVCSMTPLEIIAPSKYLQRNEISVWFSVPAVAAMLLRRGALVPGSMPTLRWSLFCGEALPRSVAEAWQAAASSSVLENLYGPTELTVACSVYRWNQQTSPEQCVHDIVPIGRPYPGLHAVVVDEQLEAVAPGESGELCVAGAQTTPGYWRAPELTEERYFIRDGATYYRTGDLVRERDGEYLFIGRNDQQVKVGGYRIELGEVEAELRRSGCEQAVCLVSADEASITAIISGASGDPEQHVAAVAARLPSYMVPRSIHVLDAMPVNGNGKVDRGALRRWLATDTART